MDLLEDSWVLTLGKDMISDVKNKALERFINLALLNIVGIKINSSHRRFGAVEPYVFAEDEEACLEVGWNPYHVDLGKNLNDNTLTFSTATSWGNNLTPATLDPEKIKNLIADDITEKQDSAWRWEFSLLQNHIYYSKCSRYILQYLIIPFWSRFIWCYITFTV